jgi:1,4-dihydroxy-6-naphthoate synthase
MGEGYGPVVIAAEPMSLEALAGKRVGIPGLSTTAWHVLRMMIDVEPVVTPISPYHLIFDALREGRVDAGLIIHEGRLTYEAEGFVQIADLGVWWAERTGGLPLPLGGNSIRRDLGPEAIARISATLRDAIAHSLEHRDEAIAWLLERGGPLGTYEAVDRYLDMYANARTLDYGPEGVKAIETFMRRGAEVGLFDEVPVDFSP